MNYEILGALVGFAFVTSVTPGPNNLMLTASGANFGVRRTVPHMLGISLGHAFMVTMVVQLWNDGENSTPIFYTAFRSD